MRQTDVRSSRITAFEVRQGFVLDYLSLDFWLAADEIQTGAASYLARKRALAAKGSGQGKGEGPCRG